MNIKSLLKKIPESIWMLLLMIIFLSLHLFGLNIFPDVAFPSVWIGFFIGITIRNVVKKEKEISGIVFALVFILNYFILFKLFKIFVPGYAVFIFAFFGIIIYYSAFKEKKRHMNLKILGLILIIIVFLGINHFQNGNNLIKDRNFRMVVGNNLTELGIVNKNEVNNIESLNKIKNLFIPDKYKIIDFKEIEKLQGIEKIYVAESINIKNFEEVSKLKKLKRLVIWYMDVDILNGGEKIKNLEYLEILYPEHGVIKNLDKFPNLKNFEIQGISFENLDFLKGSVNLEYLSLAVGQVFSFSGIEDLENLVEINFYEISSNDFERLLNLKNLKTIRVQEGNITSDKEFMEGIKNKDIDLLVFDENEGDWIKRSAE